MDAHILSEATDIKQRIAQYLIITVVGPAREKDQVVRQCRTSRLDLL